MPDMGITTARKAPPRRVEPIERVVVRNDRPGNDNYFEVGPGSRNLAGEFVRQDGRAHLVFVQGSGLYLKPETMRQLASDLVEIADQIGEDDR